MAIRASRPTSADRTGSRSGHVLEMQRLAAAGDGLNTYINRHVRGDYAGREALDP